MTPRPNLCSRPRGAIERRRGFTLIEAALVMVVVGVGVVSLMALLGSGTAANADAAELTTAINLAGNIREMSLGLAFEDPELGSAWATKESTPAAYDDVKDLDGETFQPPIDARRQALTGYDGWAQVVSVETVAEDYVNSVRPDDPTAPLCRISVTVRRNGRDVYSTNWLAANAE